MKLEDQVVSLELAKKLKELGVKQESLWNWLEASDGARLMRNPVASTYDYFDQCSAYTVAELGEMLPNRIRKKNDRGWDGLQIWKHNGYFNIEYHETFDPPNVRIMADGMSEADARAKMLIYLLENKLIEL